METEQLVELITARVAEALTGKSNPPPMPTPAECGQCQAKDRCDPTAVLGSIRSGAQRVGTNGALDSRPCDRVASLIDHTLLKPEATRKEVQKVCEEARTFGFASVCVNSTHIPFAAACLSGSGVKPIAVVGFPLGAMAPAAKAYEAREAVRHGAREIDMVLNIGALKARDHETVLDDIAQVVRASRPYPVKVILETAKLDDEEKLMACALSKAAGAAFVKTSTGFGGGGATPEDVALMRRSVGPGFGVKASGGVRDRKDALRVIEAGANRIGASSSVAIVQGKRATGNY